MGTYGSPTAPGDADRMVDQSASTWENRAHFFAIAARIMRRVIVDHARKHAP